MSGTPGTDYTTTPNLGLFKPIANRAVGQWGDLWNSNADAIDAAIHFASGGGPFLPLAGGTLARHMTSAASDANLFINATAVGSGVNGPATGQFGLSINLVKDNWFTGPAAVGELDGLVISARQGGTGDCGGILINVQGCGTGFLAIDESVSQQVAPGTGAPLYGIRTQEGGLAPSISTWIGKTLIADYGHLTTAIRIQNTNGQGYWGHAIEVARDGVQSFVLDDIGNITTTGSMTGAGIHATDAVYLRADTSVKIYYNGGGNIGFWLGGNTAEVLAAGGFAVYGNRVIGPQITGWGTSTGGARGAITASSTLPQVAAALSQLLTDLKTHGMLGT